MPTDAEPFDRAYARGFQQATEAAISAVRRGATGAQLEAYGDAVRDWREGRTGSYAPPTFGETLQVKAAS